MSKIKKIANNVSYNLGVMRKHKRLSDSYMADLLEVSPDVIKEYETGRRQISAAKLYILAKRLDMPIENFCVKLLKSYCIGIISSKKHIMN